MDQLHASTRTVDASSQEVPLGQLHPIISHISGATNATRGTLLTLLFYIALILHYIALLSHCCRKGIARTVTTTKKCLLGRAESCAELRLGKAVRFKEKNVCLSLLRCQNAAL